MNTETINAPPDRILVVDDTTANLQLLTNLLTAHGYTVHPASDGELALEFVWSTLPDLILLDIKMPGMDGFEVCRRLKADERTRSIPIIFISILEDEGDKVKGFQAGGVDFITKPFQPEEVLARVRTHLRLQKLTEHLEQQIAERTAELTQANRQLRQQILERERAELLNHTLFRITDAINTTANLEELYASIHETLGAVIDTTNFYIALYHKATNSISFPYFEDDMDDDYAYVRDFTATNSLTGEVILSRAPLFLTQGMLLERAEKKQILGTAPKIWLGVPLKIKTEVVGVMAVQSYSDAERFKKADLAILNAVAGQIATVIDRKRAEEELKKYRDNLEEMVRERTEELIRAKEQAEAANAAKSDFLARMSHEIRTPLNAVTGLTNIVLKSDLTTAQRDYLNKVQIASRNLLAVINDILDFSKVEAGRLELTRAPFDLDQMLERLTDLFSNRMAQKDLELIFAVDPDVPRQLAGDAGRLSQVLTNLVENAVKFTEKGEIVVGVEVDDGRRTTDDTRLTLRFEVSDTGIGIPAGALPALFEPFTQVGSYLTRKHEGTGLGLAICRRLVELMGGRIWAESTPDKGSTFSFTAMLTAQKKEKPRLIMPADLHGLKTLVADDSATARQVMSDILESFSFNISEVDSGEKAIEELHSAAAGEPYQLVVLDWKMPGMDGIETATAIRNDPDLDHPPIIILVTAYGHKIVREQIETEPVDTLLLKPVKASELFNTIMELFGKKEGIIPRRVKESAGTPIHRLAGRRVLVVEDSALNRVVAVALLEEAGLEVEIAENGQVAVDKVTGSEAGYYDAVLMDIQMPVMDGYAATREIRKWEHSRCQVSPPIRTGSSTGVRDKDVTGKSKLEPDTRHPTPIIALTAHALKGEREKCLAAGMDDYIAKPIDEQELHRVLEKWIVPGGGEAFRVPGSGFRV